MKLVAFALLALASFAAFAQSYLEAGQSGQKLSESVVKASGAKID